MVNAYSDIVIKMLAFYKISRELDMNGLDTTVTQQKMSKLLADYPSLILLMFS